MQPFQIKYEAAAKRLKIPIKELLKEAGISWATWWRWQKGSNPNIGTLNRLDAVIAKHKESKTAMRLKKIESLKKQISKLEKLSFK